MTAPSFRLKFDGPALAEHEIDVADLAPALIALGQMVKAANRVVNGDALDVAVKVRTVGDGSFYVDLTVQAHGAWAVVRDFVTGSDVDAVLKLITIIGLVGGGGTGAIALIRRIRGRRPRRLERRGSTIMIEFDGETIEADEASARVAFDPAFRTALERVAVEPLDKPGIDRIVLEGSGVEEEITRETAGVFLAPPVVEESEFETHHTKVFSIIDLSFKSGKKWRLSDGHGRATLVDVEDADFIARIENSEIAFAKGDLLVCDVRETARQTAKGLRADYAIVKVREHRPAGSRPQQTRLEL
ncbi:hypothetical protein ASF53_05120 [Methylobacterium sp. Leaf123]|uniref:hypothetical protein n=1 Tax=Methylobacterium sp. Leaf123 TaxID=1736264 RepID=UPI0006FF86A2|nr:hypothetical protein [Methylobacterium sp. Leaf123]KQQ23708.1 hypothetical protein ASF53_05120 [Methylobacterium sp. Leaf123]